MELKTIAEQARKEVVLLAFSIVLKKNPPNTRMFYFVYSVSGVFDMTTYRDFIIFSILC